ncbi:membrane protein EE62A [Proboscivirus elephantidbeta5]|uniref:Membrane protein EE62A n=1 Tax=Elephant endotheliotropic herpesvirus 5 TaxID=768738 RepID=A0A075CXS5_9BETA|nr:membrane protein EE62A [Elephant endotheliotropic herpesvirus 5]AHC02811.1 membrane protein EE62A [Elephant endotheliotropic herpesvirus 5]
MIRTLWGGGFFTICSCIYTIETSFNIQKVNLGENATIILQSSVKTNFTWLHNNKTIVNGEQWNSSYNSTKFFRKDYYQCCDLTIINTTVSDLGNYTLRLYINKNYTEDVVELTCNDLPSTSRPVTKGNSVLLTSNNESSKVEYFKSVTCKCRLFIGIYMLCLLLNMI